MTAADTVLRHDDAPYPDAFTRPEVGWTPHLAPLAEEDLTPRHLDGLVDLLEERAAETRGESPEHPAWPGEARPSVCEPGCCPNLRAAKPALCGRD